MRAIEFLIEYDRNKTAQTLGTGEGDAQRVFATVLTAIQQYIKKYKPQRLSFSAAKEVEPEKNSNSRAKLYDRLVQRYARLWGYKAFRSETGDIVIYELSRLKPAVAEGYSNTTFQSERKRLNVPALIKAGAIFVTYPHDEPGWETDNQEDWAYSLITLYNVMHGGWTSEAKKYLKPASYKKAEQQINSSAPNLGSDKLVYDGKYNQILWSIKKLGIPDNVAFLDNGNQGVAEGKITLSTDPSWYGATVDNYQASGPVVNIPANQLVGFEPDDKMNQPKSKVNVEKIVAGLKQGAKLPPLLVRKYKNGYQVLDGHHRFWAYKLLGVKSIPAQIVPAEDVEEIGKQGVAEATGDAGQSYRKFTPKSARTNMKKESSILKGLRR
jgi:hypothetical protein